jgi:hypothetical protein
MEERPINYNKNRYLQLDEKRSGDDFIDSPPFIRVIIKPFKVFLKPTSRPLAMDEVDVILLAMEQSVFEFTQTDMVVSCPIMTELDFFRIGKVTVDHSSNQTAIIAVENGVASFEGPTDQKYDPNEINVWISEMLSNSSLVDYLQELKYSDVNIPSILLTIDSVHYEFPVIASPSNIHEVQSQAKQVGKNSVYMIGLIVMGFVLACLLIFLAIRKQRRKNSNDHGLTVHRKLTYWNSVDKSFDQSGDPILAIAPSNFGRPKISNIPSLAGSGPYVRNREINDIDQQSIESSESSLQPTEDVNVSNLFHISDRSHMTQLHKPSHNDVVEVNSSTLKDAQRNSSIDNLRNAPSFASTDGSLKRLGVATAESFDMDRNIVVRKDMLTTGWTSYSHPYVTKPNEAPTSQSTLVSVLKPSYFSASQENEARAIASEMQMRDHYSTEDIEILMPIGSIRLSYSSDEDYNTCSDDSKPVSNQMSKVSGSSPVIILSHGNCEVI